MINFRIQTDVVDLPGAQGKESAVWAILGRDRRWNLQQNCQIQAAQGSRLRMGAFSNDSCRCKNANNISLLTYEPNIAFNTLIISASSNIDLPLMRSRVQKSSQSINFQMRYPTKYTPCSVMTRFGWTMGTIMSHSWQK